MKYCISNVLISLTSRIPCERMRWGKPGLEFLFLLTQSTEIHCGVRKSSHIWNWHWSSDSTQTQMETFTGKFMPPSAPCAICWTAATISRNYRSTSKILDWSVRRAYTNFKFSWASNCVWTWIVVQYLYKLGPTAYIQDAVSRWSQLRNNHRNRNPELYLSRLPITTLHIMRHNQRIQPSGRIFSWCASVAASMALIEETY